MATRLQIAVPPSKSWNSKEGRLNTKPRHQVTIEMRRVNVLTNPGASTDNQQYPCTVSPRDRGSFQNKTSCTHGGLHVEGELYKRSRRDAEKNIAGAPTPRTSWSRAYTKASHEAKIPDTPGACDTPARPSFLPTTISKPLLLDGADWFSYVCTSPPYPALSIVREPITRPFHRCSDRSTSWVRVHQPQQLRQTISRASYPSRCERRATRYV